MDRRMFIDAVTASIVAVPVVALAQEVATVRRIGVLDINSPETQAERDQAFAPLRALGWVEGKNLLVERRYGSRKVELLRPFAEELVRLKVEIIGTVGTQATLAAKDATKTIPIVIWVAWDPVRTGLVASLSRPGGNVTGLSLLGPEIDAKRLSLLRELVPGLQRVGVLQTANLYYNRAGRSDFEQACQSVGVQPIFFEVATQGEVENAIAEMARRGAQALIVPGEPLFYENPVPVMAAALRLALPTVSGALKIMAEGALVSLSYSDAEQYEVFAWFVDRILRGAKPADLPMQQPTRFELGVNLKAAKALGITVPQSILLRATEVIK